MSFQKDVTKVLEEPYDNGFATKGRSSSLIQAAADAVTPQWPQILTSPKLKSVAAAYNTMASEPCDNGFSSNNGSSARIAQAAEQITGMPTAGSRLVEPESKITETVIPSFQPGTVFAQINFLQGRVLTLMDASFSDPVQRKAAKDLVKAQFRDRISYMRRLIGDDSNECSESE